MIRKTPENIVSACEGVRLLAMDARQLDMNAWEAVEADLSRLVDAARSRSSAALLAPLQHRIAIIRLRRALLAETAAVREAVGEEDDGALAALLDRQLGGDPVAKGVLEALGAEARGEAMAALREALAGDRDHRPALRAAAALASAAGRWPEAVGYLERLVDREQGDAAGRAWHQLGDIWWRKLASPAKARPCYQKARQILGDETKLLDKLLKLDLELENWEEAISACHALIDKMQRRKRRPELAVTYMLTMGEIHVYGMRQPQVAMTYYLMAQSTMPDYVLSYQLLQELVSGNEWEMVEPNLDLLPDDQVELITPSLDRLRIAVEQHPGDAAGAIKAFREGATP